MSKKQQNVRLNANRIAPGLRSSVAWLLLLLPAMRLRTKSKPQVKGATAQNVFFGAVRFAVVPKVRHIPFCTTRWRLQRHVHSLPLELHPWVGRQRVLLQGKGQRREKTQFWARTCQFEFVSGRQRQPRRALDQSLSPVLGLEMQWK